MEKTNVIAIPEKRETVDRIKNNTGNFMDKLRDTYQEKVIDSGLSDKLDKFIDTKAKVESVAIGALGTIATIGLAICPADGPIGEACTAILTPGLLALVNLSKKIENKGLATTKNFVEKKILQIDKENDNVEVYNDQGELMKDVMEVISDAKQLGASNTLGAA